MPEGAFLWWIAGVALWVSIGKWSRSGRDLSNCVHQRQEAASRLTQLNELLRSETNPQLFDERFPLVAERESRARHRFLESHKIEDAKLSGVGPAKRAMLQSYKIESAADIARNTILDVPGFGPALATRLEDWRDSVERTFRINPNSAVEPRDIVDLDRKLAQERSSLEHALLQGANELSQIRQQIPLRRKTLLTQAATLAQTFAQAEADCRALSNQA